MVDAARQLLNELMGRNRNLDPSEASRKINWDDPDFCQYYLVRFCPHDLFINTRADLGPCARVHDDEARELYTQARPSARKRQYEDEFLRFCNTMLNDVDRKIQKGKQRLQLMHRDQPMPGVLSHVSKFQEQLMNLTARIKKLLSEAEEAGIRGDVDQAQDLMALCERLKDEKEALMAQHAATTSLYNSITSKDAPASPPQEQIQSKEQESDRDRKDEQDSDMKEKNNSPKSDGENDKKSQPWVQDLGTLPEKQMEVCETCGAFLIVGDAQQRIEDHLMGKQHLGYSKLRKAVEEIHERRQKEREEEERKRREERTQRTSNFTNGRGREFRENRDNRGRMRDHGRNHQRDNHRHYRNHYPSSRNRRSHNYRRHSRERNERDSRSRSRTRSRSRSRSRY